MDVVGTGFTVLDRVYAGSLDVAAEDLGGSCGNVLVSLAMLDRQVAPVLTLGWDEAGALLEGAFRHAGAETRYIQRRSDVRSPILAQHLVAPGVHTFAFRCPETDVDLPRYRSIDGDDLARALPVIRTCSVFYTDRTSATTVEGMEAARAAGGIVFFEPSAIDDEELFERALAASSIVKFSADRLSMLADLRGFGSGVVMIVTHGEDGLEVRRDSERLWCRSFAAPEVRDTCGSGDMVSVGVIDRLLADGRPTPGGMSLRELVEGVRAGQRLAAENCAFVGARGLFRERGASYARSVLTD